MIRFIEKAAELKLSCIILNPNEVDGKKHTEYILETYFGATVGKFGKYNEKTSAASRLYILAHSAGGWMISHACNKYCTYLTQSTFSKKS
jgi:hypothetical protein